MKRSLVRVVWAVFVVFTIGSVAHAQGSGMPGSGMTGMMGFGDQIVPSLKNFD